ncbi:MAG: hypothetical protein WA919_20620 [Coleofasciculaceae cyanobacterium]
MLTNNRVPVSLSLLSLDLPIWSTVETAATLYQKDQEKFHLLLKEPNLPDLEPELTTTGEAAADIGGLNESASRNNHPSRPTPQTSRLLWLEISPYRVIMTMQEQGKLSYRHLWEQGVYGISRYWCQRDFLQGYQSFQLRNYTRSLRLEGRPLPQNLRLEYELWSGQLMFGHYVLNLDIHH